MLGSVFSDYIVFLWTIITATMAITTITAITRIHLESLSSDYIFINAVEKTKKGR